MNDEEYYPGPSYDPFVFFSKLPLGGVYPGDLYLNTDRRLSYMFFNNTWNLILWKIFNYPNEVGTSLTPDNLVYSGEDVLLERIFGFDTVH